MKPRVVSTRDPRSWSARTKVSTIGTTLGVILGAQYHAGVEFTHMRFGRSVHARVNVKVRVGFPLVSIHLLMVVELFRTGVRATALGSIRPRYLVHADVQALTRAVPGAGLWSACVGYRQSKDILNAHEMLLGIRSSTCIRATFVVASVRLAGSVLGMDGLGLGSQRKHLWLTCWKDQEQATLRVFPYRAACYYR